MNNQIPETDQWQLNGDCDKCRRANYCTNKCSVKKRRLQGIYRALGNAIIDTVAPTPTIAENVKKWW